jgi:hypothetical protein
MTKWWIPVLSHYCFECTHVKLEFQLLQEKHEVDLRIPKQFYEDYASIPLKMLTLYLPCQDRTVIRRNEFEMYVGHGCSANCCSIGLAWGPRFDPIEGRCTVGSTNTATHNIVGCRSCSVEMTLHRTWSWQISSVHIVFYHTHSFGLGWMLVSLESCTLVYCPWVCDECYDTT